MNEERNGLGGRAEQGRGIHEGKCTETSRLIFQETKGDERRRLERREMGLGKKEERTRERRGKGEVKKKKCKGLD